MELSTLTPELPALLQEMGVRYDPEKLADALSDRPGGGCTPMLASAPMRAPHAGRLNMRPRGWMLATAGPCRRHGHGRSASLGQHIMLNGSKAVVLLNIHQRHAAQHYGLHAAGCPAGSQILLVPPWCH